MNPTDLAAWVERLHDGSDEDRYQTLRQAGQDHALRQPLRDACLLLLAACSTDASHHATPSTEEIALDLARGRVSRQALADPEAVAWLLASLATAGSDQAEVSPRTDAAPRASASTRSAMRTVVRAPRPHRRPFLFWIPALGAAAAASVLLAVVLTPSSEPWAASLGMTRWQVGRLSPGFRAAVESTVQDGLLSPAVFEVPARMRRERDALAVGVQPPLLLHPRWEATTASRPAFRWHHASDNDSGTGSEVILLDGARQLLWSARIAAGGELAYPVDQPQLEPGATYYWKVNRLGGERLIASAYAGFRLLGEKEQLELEHDLSETGEHPFLQGTAYDRHGVYTAATDAFQRVSHTDHLGNEARQAALAARDSIRAKQGLIE